MSQPASAPASPGTSQAQRVLAALDPSNAPLDGRSLGQLSSSAREFADHLAYWTSQGQFSVETAWRNFLPDIETLGIEAAEKDAASFPQKALFLTFLKLFQHAQQDLNGLTERHLNFYYKNVLRLAPHPAQPDHAHLVLSLKKSIAEGRVPLGSLFKTATGLNYQSTIETFLYQSTVAHLRTIHVDPVSKVLRAAPISNSADGLGEKLSEEDPSWHPFGYNRNLPAAIDGFALSSPVLVMREGLRKISVLLTLNFASSPPNVDALRSHFEAGFEVKLSSDKDWIIAKVSSVVVTVSNSSPNLRTITLNCEIANGEPAIVPYNPTVLTGGYDTLAPVMRWETLATANALISLALSEATVQSAQIKVDVSGMKNVNLENDHGKLDASKPFFPFGPVPKIGSSFYIGADEALQKKVTAASLSINWKSPPSSLKNHYQAYDALKNRENNAYTAQFQILRNGIFQDLTASPKALFSSPDATAQITIDSSSPTLSFHKLGAIQYEKLFSRAVPQARVELPFSRVMFSKPLSPLRASPALSFREPLLLSFLPKLISLSTKVHSGFLRLRLNQDFGHEKFPEIFSSNVSFNSHPDRIDQPNKQRLVPNQPYTPEVAAFSLSYQAETELVLPNDASSNNFQSREIRFFHINAFGQREEHAYIKSTVQAENLRTTLLPSRESEGQLLIGLTGLQADQSVSLLFQVKDGTADPNSTRREIEWSVLGGNHWRPLADENILLDTTNGFLSSGIVRVLIPRTVTHLNTLLEPGFTWIRARVTSQTRAVCRFLTVDPNAVPVSLLDIATATHLESGLPAKSIAASALPLRGVKEIKQPYVSLGGAAPETEPTFRTRISERLRHRGRASTAWDFEHLVLQKFPRIYKAQTLNHTDRFLNRAPGHVTLVVLPDARSSESAVSLTPQVDAATLAEIHDYLTTISSPFVTATAINPVFEPIHVEFKVKFRDGNPFAAYREILRQEIQAYLAPWAHGGGPPADLGGFLYRSGIIAFIDSLPYVDYLTDFSLFHQAVGATSASAVQIASASKPGTMLTPVTPHVITSAI